MSDRFDTIRNKFPDHRDAFDYLLTSNEDFLEICEDYEECARALADSRLERYSPEFRLLCNELEDEMLTWLIRVKLVPVPTEPRGH